MQTILLTSANYVKSVTLMSDNISDKYITPVINECQVFDYQSIVGTAMYEKLCSLVQTGDITSSANTAYKRLLDKSQLFLAYDVAAKIVFQIAYKCDNSGVFTNEDENKKSVDIETLTAVQGNYQSKADGYAAALQRYIIKNYESLPEIDNETLVDLEANLYSAASTNIWLGGKRGKIGGYRYDNSTDFWLD